MSDRPLFEVTTARQREIQEDVFRRLREPTELPHALADATHAHASKFLGELPDVAELACAKGCSYCCHQPATVFPFEAIRIASVLRATLSQERLEALKEKMRSRVNGLRGASVAKNIENKTACPLLSADGQCSVYSNRPLTCRLAHSFSVKRCRLSFQKSRAKITIPMSLDLVAGISGLIEAAFDELPKKFKRDGNLYELCSAVLRALDDPNAAANWANGRPGAFESCVRDDTGTS